MGNDIGIQTLQQKIDDLNQRAWKARVNNTQIAFESSQESLNLARSINYRKGIAEATRSLGFHYARLSKNDEAYPLLQESLSLFESMNDLKGQAVVNEYLAIVQRSWGNLGDALELLFKALDLSRRTGFKENEAFNQYQIGVTYKHLGHFEKALDHLFKSLSTHRATGNRLFQSYPINIIGSIYFENGDYTKALEYYKEGLVSRRESNDKLGEAGSLDNIGFTYLKLKDYEQAIDYCTQSLVINKTTGDKRGMSNALLHLAEAFRQKGDLEKATKYSNESLDIKKATGDKKGEAEIFLFLADLYKKQPEKDKQVLDWLNNSLKIAEDIKAVDLLSKTRFHLYEYYKQRADHEEALKNLDQHTSLEKEFHKNTIDQKISNLEISHKAEVVSQRNKELTELNEKIEKANEELKIEAALERVRAVAMGMKEPADMLRVCRMISDQLRQLGFKEIRNVQTVIFYPEKHEYLNYQYFTPYDKDSIETIDYRLHPDVLAFTNQMLASADAYYTKTFEGDELKVWREYRKQTNQLPDPKLDATTSSHYYFYSIGSGALGVTTYASLNEKEIGLFKRFRNVFELAYRRFIDIEKAQAQAKEAQIETSLERVRAVAMSMRIPDELLNICEVLFKELEVLEFKDLRNTIINIYDEEKGSFRNYDSFGNGLTDISTSKFNSHRVTEKVTKQIRGTRDAFVEFYLSGDELEDWKKFKQSMGEITDPKLQHASILYYYFYSVGTGALGISTLTQITAQHLEILKRFKNVFELSYRRYADIEKAEAQAREAQIEAALERVRAASMAMHHSDDLVTVIDVVKEQLTQLGFHFHGANFVTDYSEKGYTMWLAAPGESFPSKIYVPQIQQKLFKDVSDAVAQGLDFATYTLGFEEKNLYFKNLFENSLANTTTEDGKKLIFEAKGMAASVALLSKIRLNLMNLDLIPYTDEENNILKRIAYVFEQSYIRFLDLQKAEAQAREAKIEVSLERIRARAIGMHKSEELSEVLSVLFEQFDVLGIDPVYTYLNLISADGNSFIFRATGKKGWRSFEKQIIDINSSYVWKGVFENWKNSKPNSLNALYFPKEMVPFLLGLVGKMSLAIPELYRVTADDFPEGMYTTDGNCKFGYIGFGHNRKATKEEEDIVVRFATEFGRLYQRFLDLQKAEAQAREAQIEAALERVRGRTMAMQKPEELDSVIKTVYAELKQLDVSFERCFIMIFDEQKGATWWMGSHDDDLFHEGFYVPYHTHQPHLAYLKGWEERQQKWEYLLEGKVKKEWDEFIFNETELSKLPEIVIQFMKSFEHAYLAASFENFGCITTGGRQGLSEDSYNILIRFAKVFDLSYTRFLDLEKAKAQAREAQIETGLERVRSKTMAMHKSEEVTGVAVSLNEELIRLGFSGGSTIIIMNKETGDTEQWTGFSADKTLKSCYVPYFNHPFHEAQLDAWKNGKKFLVYTVKGEEKKTLDEHYFSTGYKDFPESDKKWMRAMESVSFSHAFMKFGAIHWGPDLLTEEQLRILQRFAKVFEQSYTRFLDLQKAEAQTREAQIEVAVERVRAKALAMHRSEDLHGVVVALKKELLGLQIPGVIAATIYLAQDDGSIRILDLSGASEGDDDSLKLKLDKVFRLEGTDPDLWVRRIWEGTQKYFVVEADEADFTRVVKFLYTIDKAEAETAENIIKEYSIKKAWLPTVRLEKGKLNIDLLEPPSAEVESILLKMGAGFDLAYKRFLDLQKAEAQTKEAQTEVALERIRARAMAMHSSKELMDVAHILREQMGLLDQPDLETSVVNLFEEDSDYIHSWHAFREPGLSSGRTINGTVSFRKDSSELTKEMIDHYHSGEKEFTLEAAGEKLNEFIQVLINSEPEISNYIGKHPPEKVYYHFATFTGGALLTVSYQATTEDIKSLQRRAASVFDMAYRRYLDLKKAEAQTREAQIEIAVERVRAKALAMHKSEEILSVVAVLRNELLGLNIPGVSGTSIYLKEDDGRIRMWDLTSVIELEDGFHLTLDIVFSLEKTHPELYIRKLWNSTEKYAVQIQTRDDLVRTVDWLGEYKKEEAENVRRFIETIDLQNLFHATVPLANGKLSVDLMEAPPVEMEPILQKMATAFDLAYKRFLDLQNAEAQAREAQIEAALERVRAKVMAMTNSKDLDETSLVFGEQLRKLNVEWQFSYFWLIDEAKHDTTFWITWPDNKTSLTAYTLTEAAEYFNDCLVAWRGGVKIHDNYVPPARVQEWLDTFQRIADDAGGVAKEIMVASTFPTGVYYYDAMMKYGSFGICISKPATDEEKKIQCRFAIEFERAYTRFLDLKQAEAQTRESQIELGLERVRARAMAMQNSDELKELIGTVYTELTKLDLILDRCFIMIYDNKSRGVTWWMSNPEAPLQPIGLFVKYHEQPPYRAFIKGWKERNLKWQYVLEGEVKKTWDKFLFVETELSHLPDIVIASMKANEKVYLSASFNNFGCLTLATLESLSDEHFDILLRFAKVFDLTYTRFNDLKQAEAQAREAQIEAALERVRAMAMSMKNPDDLKHIVEILFAEIHKLGFTELRNTMIQIHDDALGSFLEYDFSHAAGLSLNTILYNDHPVTENLLRQVRSANDAFAEMTISGKELKEWREHLVKAGEEVDARLENVDTLCYYFYSIGTGSIGISTYSPISAEKRNVLKRFRNVFDLAYKSYIDITKAEAQAREAKIEAALERVRSKAMAMHKSEDLNPAVATVFEELDKLSIGILRCGIAIMDKEKPRADVWITVKSEQVNTIQVSGDESLDYHPLLLGAYNAWVKQVDFSYVLQGEDLVNYYRDVASMIYQLPVSATFDIEKRDQQQYYFNTPFQDGSLFAFMDTAFTDEAKIVMKRFANVFNLTYKRFLDLQKAESQAREAKIEAALERVRARALAMQEPEELKEVAQVLRTEMGLLGVEELETCSIYINDEATNKTECWYALKDLRVEEKKLVSDHFPLNLNDTWVGREMKNFYRSDAKQVSIVMQGANRKEWINYCEEKSLPFRGYYGEVIPDRTYHLYRFSHGAIGAAAAGDISVESWKLLSRAASVFSLAYSRFKDLTQARNDLIQLKEEKKRAEDALTELQTTQKQLIQSEKMASLGELTAGIAHEIQNPLNFVNNFSDVSNELLEEMKQELATGNTQQAIEIVNNVKENLEKILHHGKRADAIVKGMLQHSRTSSGQKELTDINILADEYLRLAYHGLRAKDKFFNAKFETVLDPSIDKISVVPQEIGRVILNLINNSFYAVSEKKKDTGNGYEPTVIVSTKKEKDKIEIRVKDNGNGIPQKVLEKIFQPFFTTKPTGQGTGLGLSLSYDIITKGHGGEIKVKTREGEGSEFIISLPVN